MNRVMDENLAKKIVRYVKEHSNVTWADIENNIPELRNHPELREFAVEGCPRVSDGFLVKIDDKGIVSLGPVAYLID